MARINQVSFVLALLGISWLVMQATHELGHVVGATITGGTVQKVVIHPLQISRTDVSPNPNPAVVVWLGPVIGCVLPLVIALLIRRPYISRMTWFVAGFCFIANGAYIGFGAIDQIGDCKVMLSTGSPAWTLVVFGIATLLLGFVFWHQLGSPGSFFSNPKLVTRMMGLGTTAVFLACCAALHAFSG